MSTTPDVHPGPKRWRRQYPMSALPAFARYAREGPRFHLNRTASPSARWWSCFLYYVIGLDLARKGGTFWYHQSFFGIRRLAVVPFILKDPAPGRSQSRMAALNTLDTRSHVTDCPLAVEPDHRGNLRVPNHNQQLKGLMQPAGKNATIHCSESLENSEAKDLALEAFRQFFESNNSSFTLVDTSKPVIWVEAAGKTVGAFVHDTLSDGEMVWIDALFVLPTWRNQDIGGTSGTYCETRNPGRRQMGWVFHSQHEPGHGQGTKLSQLSLRT